MIFKIDNSKFPLPLDTLDITSDQHAEKDADCNLESQSVFNFTLNELDNSIVIEPKSENEGNISEILNERVK